MNHHNYPILEHDDTPEAFIEPGRVLQPIDIALYCVPCFFQDVIATIVRDHNAHVVVELGSEIGKNPIYEIDMNGRKLAFFHPGVGAPLAGGFLDEVIALGCRKFIACGGAGALVPELTVGHMVVPTSAVRDEGTSYHYLPPSREVSAHPAAISAIEAVLRRDNVPHMTGKTWTTDALYRETPKRIARRREEGCLTVEMEAAAFFAVAQFRGVPFGQVLYGGDDLSNETWDSRNWNSHTSVREKLFWLAAEACLSL
jgi:uridine phosphorylase